MNWSGVLLRLVIVVKLLLAVLICLYFWQHDDLNSIIQLPIYILVLSVVYIGMQMLTRKLSNVQNWWDWVYYGGLVAIIVPVMLATEEKLSIYNAITDYGTIMLILPGLVDVYHLITKNRI
jgi:uncharacterized BrkB/YihY/UPF0761 family membrane protein